MKPGCEILDFGCGAGEAVSALLEAGYDAFGTDVEAYWQGSALSAKLSDRLRVAEMSPYRLPFENDSFAGIISHQVFEHIMPQYYVGVLSELKRVMQPGGISVNMFPARWRPLEAHVYVPFASVFRSRGYLAIWALLGCRNEHQQEMTWKERADRNFEYLNSRTHYPSMARIQAFAREAGLKAESVPELYVRHHPGAAGRLLKKTGSRFLMNLFCTFGQRAVVFRKP